MRIVIVNSESKDILDHVIMFEIDTNDLGDLLKAGTIQLVGSDIKLPDSKQERVIYQLKVTTRLM